MRCNEAFALEPAEQRIDRSFTHDREASLAESSGHLVAVRGLVDDDREQAEVEHSAEHLAAAALVCHAPHDIEHCLAAQGRDYYGSASCCASSTNACAACER